MKSIRIEREHVFYFGNVVGYMSENTAIVDPMFQREDLQNFLKNQKGIDKVEWVDGVYERLLKNPEGQEGRSALLKCRVWQLRPDVDVYMKFIDYGKMTERFGEPDPKHYEVAYDGEVDTNDLEALYEKFKAEPLPVGFHGHALTLSDVIELYSARDRSCFYVDLYGFQPIMFEARKPEP